MHIGIVCKYELLRICSGHRRQNMWLLKADARTIKRTGLQHDADKTYFGGMNLPDVEGQRLIIVAFSKFSF